MLRKPHSAKPQTVIGNTIKHDTKLDNITLNKEIPSLKFQLNSEDSHLLIQRVCVTSKINSGNQWTNFISKVKLTAELKYIVFDNPKGRFIDERKKQFPIHVLPDLYQVQPVFHLNALIKNETFTLGINPERKFYHTLILELQDLENLDENCTLEFNLYKFKTDD